MVNAFLEGAHCTYMNLRKLHMETAITSSSAALR